MPWQRTKQMHRRRSTRSRPGNWARLTQVRPNAGSYANYVGAAPVEVASADHARHRLSRTGDQQLNSALHTAAVTQIRITGSRANLYYLTKIAEGRTPRQAKRCLKRRVADYVWRTMTADERRLAASPGGHPGATLQSSAAGTTPSTSSSEKSLPGPTTQQSRHGFAAVVATRPIPIPILAEVTAILAGAAACPRGASLAASLLGTAATSTVYAAAGAWAAIGPAGWVALLGALALAAASWAVGRRAQRRSRADDDPRPSPPMT